MSAVFITATGTDIGKTFVAAGLLRELRRRGRSVGALKPVVSGFDADRTTGSDPAVLLAALGRDASAAEIDRISPWRFAAPLSPDMAAHRERRALDLAAVVEFSRRRIAESRCDALVIEGVGGVMAPIDDLGTVLDWMSALALPVVLVAGSYLGTISHTLSAIEVITARNLAIAAIVVNETPGSAVPLNDTVAVIGRFAAPIEVLALPLLAAGTAEHPAFSRLASLV